MQYKRCWSEADVKLYFTTESREKERDVFDETHIPIDKIFVEFSREHPEGKGFITEKDLGQWILSSSPKDHNRIFLLVGETGSGKSELCQWLEYNITDGIHIPIHISRSDTRMQDIARILDQFLPENSRETTVPMEIFGIPANDITGRLIADLIVYLPLEKTLKDKDKKYLKTLFKNKYFQLKLEREVANYQNTVRQKGKETQIVLLPRKDFEWTAKTQVLSDADIAYRYINRTITRTLKDLLKIGDVAKKLQNISEQYLHHGKRPVLLLEDLTSFTFLAEDLIDYIFDLSKGHYDVVIGWTTGFELAHREYIFKAYDALTYMQERLEARLVLTDKNRTTYFLKDRYEDLAKQYLSAIKCGKCEICRKDESGLYPFNSSCLERIYKNLMQDGRPKQTPRMFLEFVIESILLHPEYPWRTLSRNPYLKPIPSKISPTYSNFPDFEMFTKWYGKENEETIEIEPELVDWFQITVPPLLQKIGGVYNVPKSEMAKFPLDMGISERKEDTEDRIVEFQEWMKQGGTFPSRHILREGVIKLVAEVGNPCEIKNPRSTVPTATSIWWIRGSEQIPVFIEDSRDDSSFSDFKIQISRHSAPKILAELFLLGVGKKISDVDPDTLITLTEWANRKSIEYNKVLRKDLKGILGIPVEHFILFSKFLLMNVFFASTEIDIEEFKKNLAAIEKDELPFSFFDEYVQQVYQGLLKERKEIEELFSSFFLITQTFIDYPFFERVSSEISLLKTLKKVSKIDLRRIRRSYKVGTRGRNIVFHDFVKGIRNYASTLLSFSSEENLSTYSSELRSIEKLIPPNHSIEDLRTRISEIKSACAFHDIVLKEEWVKTFEVLKNKNIDFEGFRSRTNAVLRKIEECDDVFHIISLLGDLQDLKREIGYKVIMDLGEIVLAIEINNKKLMGSLENDVSQPDPNIAEVRKIYDALAKIVESLK